MVTLDEKTKVDLKINNVWAIIVSVLTTAFIVGGYFTALNSKLDTVIVNQNELSIEFSEWKKQAETRMGLLEIATNVNASRINGHQ
jgi:hypothetical protein